jgi:hypothetical protein
MAKIVIQDGIELKVVIVKMHPFNLRLIHRAEPLMNGISGMEQALLKVHLQHIETPYMPSKMQVLT